MLHFMRELSSLFHDLVENRDDQDQGREIQIEGRPDPVDTTQTKLLDVPCVRALVGYIYTVAPRVAPSIHAALNGPDPAAVLTPLTLDSDPRLVRAAQAVLTLIRTNNRSSRIRREMVLLRLMEEVAGTQPVLDAAGRKHWDRHTLPSSTNEDSLALWVPQRQASGAYRVPGIYGGEPFKDKHEAQQCAYLISVHYNQGIDAARKVFDTNPDGMRRGMVYALHLESWHWTTNLSTRRDLFDQALHDLH